MSFSSGTLRVGTWPRGFSQRARTCPRAARYRPPRHSRFTVSSHSPGSAICAHLGWVSAYCNASVAPLLGGTPEQVPERYRQANPIELLPLRVPQQLLHGGLDSIVPPEQSQTFAARSVIQGDDVDFRVIPEAGHFDLIAPWSAAWPTVERTMHCCCSHFEWQSSTSEDVVAEIAEFSYHDDARLFLLRPRNPGASQHISAAQLWSTHGEWAWRVWSITMSGEIAFSEGRTFVH